MAPPEINSLDLIDWAVATRTLPGQSVSGDSHVVAPLEAGVLLAAIDGVGHGAEAARAAEIAVGVLRQRPALTVPELADRCSTALRQSRGAVATIASLDFRSESLTWIGIGDVAGVLFRCAPGNGPVYESVLLRGGVMGGSLPALDASVLPVRAGDVLVLATDGIDEGFVGSITALDSSRRTADRILAGHFKGIDDGLVLVVRYLGGPA